MEQQIMTNDLLELIPEEKMTSTQKSRLEEFARNTLMYKFLREPSHLDEFEWHPFREMAIWQDNGTLVIMGGSFALMSRPQKCIGFSFYYVDNKSMGFAVYGETDAAVAETVTFFCSLKQSGGTCTRLEPFRFSMDTVNHFDFAAFKPEQLARIFDANPTQDFRFRTGNWSVEQSLILATRPYPLKLTLKTTDNFLRESFVFGDGGTAFVEALEKRQSSFGSLCLDFYPDHMAFSCEYVKRLVNLKIFEKLALRTVDEECVLLPFSAEVNVLDYRIFADNFEQEQFDSLDITAKDFTIKVYLDDSEDCDEVLVSLLNRIAELGHFEKFSISIDYFYEYCYAMIELDEAQPVVEALVHAINGNPSLSCLNLSANRWNLKWGLHFQKIFKAVEEHKSLQTLIVKEYPEKENPNYSWLKQLLSRNRNITVLDVYRRRCSDGSSVDELYSLNQCYLQSPKLTKESTSLRPMLVATALIETASQKYKQTALLLSNHTDMVCEYIQGVNIEELAVSESLPAPRTRRSNKRGPSKRQRK